MNTMHRSKIKLTINSAADFFLLVMALQFCGSYVVDNGKINQQTKRS